MATKTIGQLTQATTINNVDEFAIEQSGVTKRVAASVVRGDIVDANIKSDAAIAGSKLADDSITNAKIKSDAAIAYSKLAALNSAQILVGNGSNVPTAVSVTGDVTISNAGVTAIGSAKVLPAMLSQPYTMATAQASTSGTSIDFTGIPSWAKRITIIFAGVSTNGTSGVIVQLGRSAGFVVTGYASTNTTSAGSVANSTIGLLVGGGVATETRSGLLTICNISGNTWVGSGNLKLQSGANNHFAGDVTLDATLDRVRITTVNGTDTFDAGTINISYEG